MNRDPVLIRVDGTARQGWERFTRCLTYSAALQRRRRPTYFLSQVEPAQLVFNLKRVGNEWLEADAPAGTDEDLEEVIQEIRRLRPAAVVVDGPGVTEDYLQTLANTGVMVVSFDHQANIRFPSQLIINPLLSPSREAYDFATGTQLLLGERYALVRSEIRRIRPLRSQDPAPPFRAIVEVADDDQEFQIAKVVKILLNIAKLERIDLAVRSYHPAFTQVEVFANANQERVKVVSEQAQITSAITRAHFAITSGAGWSLELACVGVPQLLLVRNEAYWPTAQRLEEEGAATCLGGHENISATNIRNAVMNILTDPFERQAMARCARKLIDGRGPDRLVTGLEILLHPSRQIDLSEAA